MFLSIFLTVIFALAIGAGIGWLMMRAMGVER